MGNVVKPTPAMETVILLDLVTGPRPVCTFGFRLPAGHSLGEIRGGVDVGCASCALLVAAAAFTAAIGCAAGRAKGAGALDEIAELCVRYGEPCGHPLSRLLLEARDAPEGRA